jgi:hypothetical protein
MKNDNKEAYKGLKVGDYVRWREMDPYDEGGFPLVEKQGLVVSFRSLDEFARPFIYVNVLENQTGRITPVLVHKLEKLETN